MVNMAIFLHCIIIITRRLPCGWRNVFINTKKLIRSLHTCLASFPLSKGEGLLDALNLHYFSGPGALGFSRVPVIGIDFIKVVPASGGFERRF